MTVGYDGRGKRVVRRGSGRTKTEAKAKLRDLLRDRDDGLAQGKEGYTVAQAVEDWLTYGLGRQGASTVAKYRILCATHVVPHLGARRLRDLTAREVDALLAQLAGGVEHRDAAQDSCVPEPGGTAGDGAGFGEAKRC